MAKTVSIEVTALDEASQVFSDVESAGQEAASQIEDSWEGASAAAEEHSEELRQTQEVYAETGEAGEEAAAMIEKGWLAVSAAAIGVGAATEGLSRKQAGYTRELRMTAEMLGTTQEELRSMAVSIADVTFSVDDVVASFVALRERGVENQQQMAVLAQEYDRIADILGTDMAQTVEQSTELFGLFGGNVASVIDYSDDLIHALHSTTLSMHDLRRMTREGGQDIRELGLEMQDGLAILMAMEEETQSGRMAMREFGQATTRADGDLEEFYVQAGITAEQVESYREELEGASEGIDDLAQIHAESFTPLQRMWSMLERLQLQYGSQIELVGQLNPIIMGLGSAGLVAYGAYKILGPAVAVVATKMSGLAGATILAKAPLLAIPVAVAGAIYAFDRFGDTIRGITESELEDWGVQMDEVEDMFPEVSDEVKDSTGAIQKFMSDMTDGVISSLGDMVHSSLDSMEEWLFDSDDIYAEFEELVGGAMEKAGEHIEDYTDIFDREIKTQEEIIKDIIRSYKSLDDTMLALAFAMTKAGADYDFFEERARNTLSTIEDLIREGMEPSHDLFGTLIDDVIMFASRMGDNESAIRLVKSAYRLLAEEGRDLDEDMKSLLELIVDLGEEFEDLDSVLDDVRGGLDDTGEDIRRFEHPVEDLKREIEALTIAHEDYGIEMDLLPRIIRILEGRIKALLGETEDYEDELEELHEMLEDVREELFFSGEQAMDTADGIEDLGDETEDTAERADKLAEVCDEDLRPNINKVAEAAKKATEDLEGLGGALKDILKPADDIEASADSLGVELKDFREELEKAKFIAGIYTDETWELSDTQRGLREEFERLVSEHGKLHPLVQEMIEEYPLLAAEILGTSEEVETLTEDTEEQAEEADKLIKITDEEKESYRSLSEGAKELRDAKIELSGATTDLVDDEEKLGDELNEVIEEMNNMEEALKTGEIMARLFADETFSVADKHAIMSRVVEEAVETLGEDHWITQQLIEQKRMLGQEVGEAEDVFEAFDEEVEGLIEDEEKLTNQTEEVRMQFRLMNDELDVARDMAELLGDEEDLLEEKLAIKERRLENIIATTDMYGEEVYELAEEIKRLRDLTGEADEETRTFMDGIREGIEGMEEASEEFGYTLGETVVDETQRALTEIMTEWENAGDVIMSMIDRIAAHIIDQLSQEIVMQLFAAAGVGGGGEGIFAGSFQTGGIVPGPPTQERLILAHGGEEIIPHGQRSSRNTTINEHYYVTNNIRALDARSLHKLLEDNEDAVVNPVTRNIRDEGVLRKLFEGRR